MANVSEMVGAEMFAKTPFVSLAMELVRVKSAAYSTFGTRESSIFPRALNSVHSTNDYGVAETKHE